MTQQQTKMSAAEKLFWRRVGLDIRLMRRARGWTQAELARRMGMNRVSVVYYETGQQRIDLYAMSRIRAVLEAKT